MISRRGKVFTGALAFLVLTGAQADAGGLLFKHRAHPPTSPGVIPSTRVFSAAPPASGTLGTFAPTPYIFVRGNGQAGGGYSPLGQFGDASMTMYGPLSAFRMTSAPVLTYTRGYDGRPVVAPGTSFSAPNYPRLTPVIYPTQANYFFGFRQTGNPPWWANGTDWIDEN
jgi:hypothetical protein